MIVLRNNKKIPKWNFCKQDSDRNDTKEPQDPPFDTGLTENPSQSTLEMRTCRTKAKVKPWEQAKEPGIQMTNPHFLKIVEDIRKPFELVSNVRRSSGGFLERQFRFPMKADTSGNSTAAAKASGATRRRNDELRVMFRFCRALSCRVQADFFPPGLVVEVNGRRARLPESASPIDVSQYVFRSPRKPNRVSVTWKKQVAKYAMCISLTQKLSPFDLLREVQSKPPIEKEDTVALITKIFAGDGNCQMVGGLPVSLRCPLGLAVMRVPVKSRRCSHITCFDALTYFSLNEFRPSWKCPLCGMPAPVDTLLVDKYLSEVLRSSELGDAKEIVVNEDGSWKPAQRSVAAEKEEPAEDDEIMVCDV